MTEEGRDSTSGLVNTPLSASYTVPVAHVYQDVRQEVLMITKDKALLSIMRDYEKIEKRDRWLVPLGALIPIVVTISTTSFDKKFHLPGATWATVYVLAALGCIYWIVQSWRQRGESVSPEQMLEHLFQNAVPVEQTPVTPQASSSGVVPDDGTPEHLRWE